MFCIPPKSLRSEPFSPISSLFTSTVPHFSFRDSFLLSHCLTPCKSLMLHSSSLHIFAPSFLLPHCFPSTKSLLFSPPHSSLFWPPTPVPLLPFSHAPLFPLPVLTPYPRVKSNVSTSSAPHRPLCPHEEHLQQPKGDHESR